MITDLRAKPYFLNDDQIQWVENTIADMSDEEKIGQLFINLGQSTDEGYIKEMVEKYHIGGTRFTESKAEKVYEQNRLYQKYSKVPLLIAANCETGGDGACRRARMWPPRPSVVPQPIPGRPMRWGALAVLRLRRWGVTGPLDP